MLTRRAGHTIRSCLLSVAALSLLGACAGSAVNEGAGSVAGPLALHGNKTTLEISPVLLAARDYYPGEVSIKMGGVPNLFGEVSGSGEPGTAVIATNAETQLIRNSVDNPDLRMILNVSEGLYRIVARRSAGIENVADLAGKRIATVPVTSSGYFLARMLDREGLDYGDITAVPLSPLSEMAVALDKGDVDAVVIWEPWAEHAARVLGNDVTEISGEGVYRELFNLNTTAANLRDPEMRARIVRMVRAILDASAEIRANPAEAQTLLAQVSGHTTQDIADTWKHHTFPANIPNDILDVLVEQEQWYAERDGREPRSREELARLIDTSVYEEALALGPQPPIR
jgi:NitT/TauT family transport system substrate-binding protein